MSTNFFFKDDDQIDLIFKNCQNVNTMFLAWFEGNKIYDKGRNLTYYEIPSKFGWIPQ